MNASWRVLHFHHIAIPSLPLLQILESWMGLTLHSLFSKFLALTHRFCCPIGMLMLPSHLIRISWNGACFYSTQYDCGPLVVHGWHYFVLSSDLIQSLRNASNCVFFSSMPGNEIKFLASVNSSLKIERQAFDFWRISKRFKAILPERQKIM